MQHFPNSLWGVKRTLRSHQIGADTDKSQLPLVETPARIAFA